jgi:hypothetical protein
MEPAVLAASLLVGEVLLLSAGFKVSRRAEYASALASFTALERWPEPVRRLVGLSVPLAELAIATLILVPSTRVLGVLAATILVGAFSAVVALDRRPAVARCGCWGSARLEVPRSAYLVRNGILLAAAGAALVGSFAVPDTVPSSQDQVLVALMMVPFALLTLELPHFLHIGSIRTVPR